MNKQDQIKTLEAISKGFDDENPHKWALFAALDDVIAAMKEEAKQILTISLTRNETNDAVFATLNGIPLAGVVVDGIDALPISIIY